MNSYKDLEVLDTNAPIENIVKSETKIPNEPIMKPLLKEWCADIIRTIPLGFEIIQSGNNITIRCGTDKDAALTEDRIIANWFKAVEQYLISKEYDPSNYQKSFMLACSINNGDLLISF